MLQRIRYLVALALMPLLLGLLSPTAALADDSHFLPDGTILPAGTPTPTSTSSGTMVGGATVKAGEMSAGNALAISKISGMFTAVIDTAVGLTAKIQPEADKFAGGLGVITLILAFVTFAATKDPIKAWVSLFEELAILGIFAAFYVGYASWAPGFYKWFLGMAQTIAGEDMANGASMIGNAGGQLFDSFAQAFSGAHWWEIPALFMAVGPLALAWLVLSITSLVFLFFINIGQLQMAVGTVMGQIAFALGFSSFTRGYFKAWLDYMISAGMYVVVAAIMTALVTHGLTDAINTAATSKGLSTPGAAAYVLDLSVFIFLLAFEIPKMAGMFGGGANASGSFVGKVARVATAGVV